MKIFILFGFLGLTLAHPHRHELSRQAVDILVTETRSLESPYEISLTAFDKEFQLRLARPSGSVFTDGFTFGTSTIYKSELAAIEANIFIDNANKAALKIEQGPDGHKINGFINGHGVYHEHGQHFVTPHSHNHLTEWCGVTEDHDAAVLKMPHNSKGQSNLKQNGKGIIETQVVFDVALQNQIGSSDNMTAYAAVMFHAVNTIYDDLTNPPMQIKIAGVYALTDAEDQQILRANDYGIYKELDSLVAWADASPAGLAPNDIVALLTGVTTINQEGGIGTVGLAYRGAVCSSQRGSVNQDVGAAWAAVFTIAHEIGHNVGARHDFMAGVTCGEHGYIMGYQPGTENYFHFSECSKDDITEVVSSSGTCVFYDVAGAGVPLGNQDPGQDPAMTFDFQCNKVMSWQPSMSKIPLTYSTSVNRQENACVQMICSLPDGYTPPTVEAGPPSEGTACNLSGGKCHVGRCV